ncbi:unnamed protein product, partial [Anisakis simplex]|uniref:Non-specific serine/threonine protein kinase n=1 Tax=Anisakis simplex TaxID=6269 RepID=A0A0M3KIT3_ANISI
MSDSASSQVLSSNKQHLTNPSSINSSSSSKNSNIPIAQSQSQVSGRPNQNNLDLLCDISFGQQQPSEAQMDRGASNSVQSMSLSADEDVADRSNEQFGDFTSSSPVPSTVPSDALLNPQPIVPISLNSEVFSNEKQEAKDIYAVMKAVEGDMQGSEQEQENVHVWKRCIQEAYCLFSDADQLLPIASEIFINDIAQTERGAKYLSALRAVYEMVSRIRKGRVEELREVNNELEQIDRIWQRIK